LKPWSNGMPMYITKFYITPMAIFKVGPYVARSSSTYSAYCNFWQLMPSFGYSHTLVIKISNFYRCHLTIQTCLSIFNGAAEISSYIFSWDLFSPFTKGLFLVLKFLKYMRHVRATFMILTFIDHRSTSVYLSVDKSPLSRSHVRRSFARRIHWPLVPLFICNTRCSQSFF